MARDRIITVYGTVMATRPHGSKTMHHVEATAPGGERLDLFVLDRKRRRGSVQVHWDSRGVVEPRFPFRMPWGLLGVVVGIVAVIVGGGWLLFG